MWRIVTLFVLLTSRSQQLSASDDENRQYGNQHMYEPSEDWNEIFADEMRLAMMDRDGNTDTEPPFSGKLDVVPEWPVGELKIGQVAALATDKDGYLSVFHRAGRVWDDKTFDENNIFLKKAEGPIKGPTMFTVNASNGIVLNKWGSDFFYLPHGMNIDHHGNIWMTDVAMHQVFKFEAGKEKPVMTFGKAFEPAANAEDTERFCQPTDVIVASDDDFFVSDGYCASRILKYDKAGKLIGQFGIDDFQIPHSLALAEELDLLCVADREDMRILCYNAGLSDPSKLGEPEREYNDESLGRIFAITYSPVDGLLYGVTGPTGVLTPLGFTIDLREDERYSVDLIATWSPDDKGFDQPHDITVTPDGEAVFVGETDPDMVWKFIKEEP